MTTKPDAPADTSMMRIVHQALRRDLHRAEIALNGNPPPSAAQQVAIARHLVWMMSFLHAHHLSEDDGLYPLVRERDPAAAGLLDAMDADHRAVAMAIVEVEAAAGAVAGSASGGCSDRRLIAALTSLS
ncbi:MAG TPA: hemerythrin domain-containing protein, partial [Ilumatobacteraceae bacterium]|nr:hemerythrin domain-containing protein [Ilumatobacteraceae bacterium]